MAFGDCRVFTTEAASFRLGRFSDIGFTGLRVRFWLQAEVRRNAHYVCLTPSSRHSGSSVAPMRFSRSMRPMSAFCRFRPLYL